MSRKRENQFACSSMMLPEHREKLVERMKNQGKERKNALPGAGEGEELTHNITQSFLHGKAVVVEIQKGGEARILQGTVVDCSSREGRVTLKLETGTVIVPLDSITGCRPVSRDSS